MSEYAYLKMPPGSQPTHKIVEVPFPQDPKKHVAETEPGAEIEALFTDFNEAQKRLAQDTDPDGDAMTKGDKT
jgi:hypothetical protein